MMILPALRNAFIMVLLSAGALFAQDICSRLKGALVNIEFLQIPTEFSAQILQQNREIGTLIAQKSVLGCVPGSLFQECREIDDYLVQMKDNLKKLQESGRRRSRDNLSRELRVNGCIASDDDSQDLVNLLQSSESDDGLPIPNSGNQGPSFGLYGNYRTLCVRQCDGGFFQVHFSVPPESLENDRLACSLACPNLNAELYYFRNPGEGLEQAASVTGESYISHENAFLFQEQNVPNCKCIVPIAQDAWEFAGRPNASQFSSAVD